MKENIKQPITQERNLSLESTELKEQIDADFSRQKELRSKGEIIEENGKKFIRFKKDSSEYEEYRKISEDVKKNLEKVLNISEYKLLATPRFVDEIEQFSTPDSVIELLNIKEKVNIITEETKRKIEETTSKLNELRANLNMPETDDIPSLVQKKEKLSSLLVIQAEVENKLNTLNQKKESGDMGATENIENENGNLEKKFEEFSMSLKKVAGILVERQNNRFYDFFQDEDSLKRIATNFDKFSGKEELLSNLNKIGNIFEETAQHRGISDDPESLYQLSNGLKQLGVSLQEVLPKIENEKEKEQFVGILKSLLDKIDQAASFVNRKAQLLENI